LKRKGALFKTIQDLLSKVIIVVVVVQRLELRRKEWASELSSHSWVLRKYPVSKVRIIVVRIAAPKTIR
jgi:hypothetical protein